MYKDDLIVVIPAAGESRRFRDAGYTTIKPALKIKHRGCIASMLFHGTIHLKLPIMVGYPHDKELPRDISRGVEKIPIEFTVGQADTVYQIVKLCHPDTSIIVADCDMILRPRDMEAIVHLVKVYDVVIAIAQTFDPNASRVDTVPFPNVFVEKEPISAWGIVGVRAFRSAGELTRALEVILEEYQRTQQEPYLSMAINYYNGSKYAHQVYEFIDWGTPERVLESGAEIVGT